MTKFANIALGIFGISAASAIYYFALHNYVPLHSKIPIIDAILLLCLYALSVWGFCIPIALIYNKLTRKGSHNETSR